MLYRIGRALLTVAVLALLGGGVWFLSTGGMHRGPREELPPETSSGRDPSTVAVTTEPVTYRPVRRTVEAVGTIHGYEEVVLSAKVEGRVLKVLHDVADRVRPGEVLLEIDPTDYELAVRQADKALQVELAKLGVAEPPGPEFDVTRIPSVVQAGARAENARARMDRAQAARTAASREELADKAAEHRIAQAEYDNQILLARAGWATVQMKQESLAMSRQQLRDAVIRVPTPTLPVPGAAHGVTYAISQRAVSEGTFVRSGAELFRLVIDQTLKLRAPVPERSSGEVRPGQAAEVSTAAYDQPFTGSVTRVNPAVDPVTRTFEVEIQVPNPRGELKPGSFAKTAILTRPADEAATVPLEAVVHFAGITKVFLVESGKAKEVQVVLGAQSTTWVEVARPALPRGAAVVTSGQTALADGTPVMIRTK